LKIWHCIYSNKLNLTLHLQQQADSLGLHLQQRSVYRGMPQTRCKWQQVNIWLLLKLRIDYWVTIIEEYTNIYSVVLWPGREWSCPPWCWDPSKNWKFVMLSESSWSSIPAYTSGNLTSLRSLLDNAKQVWIKTYIDEILESVYVFPIYIVIQYDFVYYLCQKKSCLSEKCCHILW
jgi:hypothetical protein